MEWFSQNWVWVLFFIAFMSMHMFGHGGHGGHSGHGGHRADDEGASSPKAAGEDGRPTAANGQSQGHHH